VVVMPVRVAMPMIMAMPVVMVIMVRACHGQVPSAFIRKWKML
jgi:hypothetical protein